MIQLPDGWLNLPMFDICRPKQWKTISTRELTEDGYVVYGANGIIGKYPEYTHEARTLMITCRGASCGNIHVSVPFSYINGNAMALDDLREDICLLSYLKNYLMSRGFEDVISGSAQPQITREGLQSVEIPIAPLPEQKRIADKLDILLARVDAIRERLNRIPATLKQFRQAVLAAGTSGALTEEWREKNDLEEVQICIEQLREEKNRLIKDRVVKKELAFFEAGLSDNGLLDVPENWGCLSIGALCQKITDGEHSTPRRTGNGYYLLSARNVTNNGIILGNVDYVDELEFSKLRLRCDPNIGDILISCSGSVGRVALVDQDNAYVMVRSAAMIRPLQKYVNNQYLLYILQSPQLQKQMEERSKSTAQANLFLGEIRQLVVPYPSLNEQNEIVRRVEKLFAFADNIEARYQAASAQVDKLTPALLAKAFRGELVEQDPNDESAEIMLERIKVNKVTKAPVMKTVTKKTTKRKMHGL